MVFGAKTRNIEEFLPRVVAHISGADSDMVTTYLMDSVITFLRDTKLLTEVICVTLEECKESYKLHTVNRPIEVKTVRVFVDGHQVDSNSIDYRVEGDVLYAPAESCGGCSQEIVIEVELVVVPNRDSVEVPEELYEEWVDPITALTLSKLYLLTEADWYSASAAGVQRSLYQQGVYDARKSKITKHRALNIRLRNKRRL